MLKYSRDRASKIAVCGWKIQASETFGAVIIESQEMASNCYEIREKNSSSLLTAVGLIIRDVSARVALFIIPLVALVKKLFAEQILFSVAKKWQKSLIDDNTTLKTWLRAAISENAKC